MSRRKAPPPPTAGPDSPEVTVPPSSEEGAQEARPAEEEAATSEPGESGLEPSPEPAPTQEAMDALRRECEELRDALLRRRADFENYRKRVERDRHTAAQEALRDVFRDIVGTVDNLERALAAEGEMDRLRQGVELTHRELVGLLESHGVVAVDPQDERFDPSRHQALLHEPVAGVKEGTVAEVFRKGYSFGDRLLRPALVKVAKGEDAEERFDEDEDAVD